MKKRNTIIIVVVLLLGICAFFIVRHGARKSTSDEIFHIEDVNAITKIYMADKLDNQVLLERTSDTTWTVDGKYPASEGMMDMLLETLNQMRIRQRVNRAAKKNIVDNIAVSNTKVEVYQIVPFINWFGGKLQLFKSEKLVATYYIGHETQDNMGSYVFREGDDEPYIVHIPGFRGYLGPRFEPVPELWRSHRIVNLPVTEIQSVKVDIPNQPEESFELVRNGEAFDFLCQGQKMPVFDTMRVGQLLSSFVNLNFDQFAGVVPKVELDTTFARQPGFILTITDIKGNVRSLSTYIKFTDPDALVSAQGDRNMADFFDVNRLYAILDTKDTVLIQYFVFDNILQPASFFLGKDKVLTTK
ncbi:MAG: DUF4340 domain-containing protein [Bacteroidales bacterium]|nr:DUF4340 domain-containing protein [Bacteroidales bacterium]MBP5240578.1 DUF4340 domain-containing protein [Bacteroidales bacterium]